MLQFDNGQHRYQLTDVVLYNINFERFTFLSKISKYQKPAAIQFRRWKYERTYETTKHFLFLFFSTMQNLCYEQTCHSLNSHFIRAPTKISLRFNKKQWTHICNVFLGVCGTIMKILQSFQKKSWRIKKYILKPSNNWIFVTMKTRLQD